MRLSQQKSDEADDGALRELARRYAPADAGPADVEQDGMRPGDASQGRWRVGHYGDLAESGSTPVTCRARRRSHESIVMQLLELGSAPLRDAQPMHFPERILHRFRDAACGADKQTQSRPTEPKSGFPGRSDLKMAGQTVRRNTNPVRTAEHNSGFTERRLSG